MADRGNRVPKQGAEKSPPAPGVEAGAENPVGTIHQQVIPPLYAGQGPLDHSTPKTVGDEPFPGAGDAGLVLDGWISNAIALDYLQPPYMGGTFCTHCGSDRAYHRPEQCPSLLECRFCRLTGHRSLDCPVPHRYCHRTPCPVPPGHHFGFGHCPWSAGYRGPAFRRNQERDYVRVIYDQWLLDDGGIDTDADYYADLYPDLNEVD